MQDIINAIGRLVALLDDQLVPLLSSSKVARHRLSATRMMVPMKSSTQ
jgi:hypothetical protein